MNPEMTITAENPVVGDLASAVVAMAVARAWRDPAYRDALLSAPRAALAEEGLELPADVQVEFRQDTEEIRHISLPPGGLGEKELADVVVPALRKGDEREIRVLRSTPERYFIALPLPPAGLDLQGTPELELADTVIDVADAATSNVTFQTASLATTVSGAAEVVVVVVLI